MPRRHSQESDFLLSDRKSWRSSSETGGNHGLPEGSGWHAKCGVEGAGGEAGRGGSFGTDQMEQDRDPIPFFLKWLASCILLVTNLSFLNPF
jgi:hypothetical protein